MSIQTMDEFMQRYLPNAWEKKLMDEGRWQEWWEWRFRSLRNNERGQE